MEQLPPKLAKLSALVEELNTQHITLPKPRPSRPRRKPVPRPTELILFTLGEALAVQHDQAKKRHLDSLAHAFDLTLSGEDELAEKWRGNASFWWTYCQEFHEAQQWVRSALRAQWGY
jgi:hypothetical protein